MVHPVYIYRGAHLCTRQSCSRVAVLGEDIVEAAWDVAVEEVLPELGKPGVGVVPTGNLLQQLLPEQVLILRVGVDIVDL